MIGRYRSRVERKIPDRCSAKIFACFLGVCLLIAFAPAHAKDPDAIVGKWLSQQKNVGVEIFRVNGKYVGRLAWFKEPLYRLTDVRGMGGKVRIDRENPDPAKRTRPLLGLNLMWDFTFSGKQVWENGFIYDPLYGNTYCGKVTLEPPDTLKVRGYMLFTFIGKTEILTRVHEWPQPLEPAVKSVKSTSPGGGASSDKPAAHKPTSG